MIESFWAFTDIALPPDRVTLRVSSGKTVVTVTSQRFGVKTLEIDDELPLCSATVERVYPKALGFQDDASVSVSVTPVIPYREDDDDDNEDRDEGDYWRR
ncbi:hypothetical protein [Geitlerinema sp. PCC 7407]|uniref:hypothetical protein n=1 Tax=Geitlerinema sp. PCC 7407 TaxID=1173025 RepID=UPI0012370A66|nr:hypothetical protein [Geitlerinema sp. PCC 7407]